MSGKLSTHVLDTAMGRPAAGLKIQLWRIEDNEPLLLKEAITNRDGRTETPLLLGDELKPGIYELVFQVGRYFSKTTEDAFLQDVPVRFRILNPKENYHIPLLVSPWSYTTYRGS